MKTTTISFLFAFIFSVITPVIFAQPVQSSSENASDSIYLQPVEILGFRPILESKAKSRLSFQDMMSHDAGSILSKIPSISGIRKGGGYGFDPVLRGFKYDQVGILIDGIQTTTVACPNRMDPPTSQVSVNTLNLVEVHKGPYSLRYGNHIGGVINFRTLPAGGGVEQGFYSRISSGYELNGSVFRSEALVGHAGEKMDYQLAGSLHNGGDYTDGNGNLVPASFERSNLAIHAAYRPTASQELQLDITRNFARDADYAALPMDLRSDDTWMLHAAHTVQLSADKKVKLHSSLFASLVDHLMDNYTKIMDPRMVDAETAVNTRNIGGRTELSFQGDLERFTGGVDVNYENADGYRTREFLMGPNMGNILTDNVWQNGQILKTGMFAEYSRKVRQLHLHFAARVNLNMAEAMDADAQFLTIYGDTESLQVNPGITGGMEYRGDLFSYALWAGRVQRSGNLSERFMNSFPVGLDPYELIGNPSLKPEVNNQADLIITYSGSEKSRVEINLFFAYLQNYISSTIRADLSPKMPTAPGVRQYDNLDQASIYGMEVSYIQALPAQLQLRMDAALQIGNDLITGEPLPEIPPVDLRASLLGDFLKGRLRPSMSARYVFEQSRISTVFGETETPAFFLMDLDIAFKVNGWLSVSAGARNLFDVAYYEHLNRSVKGTSGAIYNPGRNVYSGITLRF